MRLSHPALKVAECHLTLGWPGVNLVRAQCQSVVGAGCRVGVESDFSSVDRACPGLERRQVVPEPRWPSALVHQQLPCVLRLVLQRVHHHLRIVWHCCSHQQGGAAG